MIFDLKKFKNFEVSIYGGLEKFTDTISKARVRIFYRGLNRNGSFITDEFAEKLISTLPYSPVKGIYNEYESDYEDHGKERTEGRAYGVVMGKDDMEFAWEEHEDEDGVTREYACANVLLWTALYEESKDIVGKGQSMELYEPSICGEVFNYEGKKVFKFTDACFLGLQVLGEEVEPCFEGSAFFSLYKSLKDITEELEKFNLQLKEKGGNNPMPKAIFKLSDRQKEYKIFQALNTKTDEDGYIIYEYCVTDVYDDYFICFNYNDDHYERINYTFDADDNIELGERQVCFVEYVSENELAALDALRTLNGGNFEQVNENFVHIDTFNEKESKIEELDNTIATLTTENENFQATIETKNTEIQTLNEQIESLNKFKLEKEKEEKEAIIGNYTELLGEEVINTFSLKIDEYTAEALEKDLAFELVKSNPAIFTQTPPVVVPIEQPITGSLDHILSKYVK